MKKVLFLAALLLVCFSGVTNAQTRKQREDAKREAWKKEKTEDKSYDKVITKEARTKKGLITLHMVKSTFYMEIPVKLMGKPMLFAGRVAEISDNKDVVAGQMPQDPMLVECVMKWGKAVVKAPWSSSGRGVKYVSADEFRTNGEYPAFQRWVSNIIFRQGGVTVEPYYNKVKDFGMEFEMLDGKVHYLGLSLFDTVKNAYTGNLLCSEEEKVEIMKKYISEVALLSARQKIIDIVEPALKENYNGPFGVDMMIAAKDGQLELVSCVELNLRRTMGHVALELAKITKPQSLMRVDFDGNRYHLRVLPGKEAVNES